MTLIHRPIPWILLLASGSLLALTRPAAAQPITHASQCHPQGSDAYAVGDTITFRYHPERDPTWEEPDGALLVPPCVDVTLDAEVDGRPPLTIEWTSQDGQLLGRGLPLIIDTARLEPGDQPVHLSVRNDAGEATAAAFLWVGSLDHVDPPMADTNPSGDLTVTLYASAHGAEEWSWDFGDGTGTSWQAQPCHYGVSIITHTYAQPGTYPVRASARNCRSGVVTGQPLEVTVGDPNVIHLEAFNAQGCSEEDFCLFAAGEEITFEVETTVAPDRYLWDWDGDGTVDEITAQPTSHAYPRFGIYIPVLTVERGTGSDVLIHSPWLLIE